MPKTFSKSDERFGNDGRRSAAFRVFAKASLVVKLNVRLACRGGLIRSREPKSSIHHGNCFASKPVLIAVPAIAREVMTVLPV